MTPIFRDSFIAALLLVLSVILLNPWQATMNMMYMVSLSAGAVALLIMSGFFLLKDKPADEREAAHVYFASRIGFLFGAAVLLLGIICESLNHAVNPWLVVALGGLFMGKFVGSAFALWRR